eukprot:6466977-Amphidinium_carterae.1
MVSWPARGSCPRPLGRSVDVELRALLEGRGKLVKERSTVMKERQTGEKIRLHHDAMLGRRGQVYHEFVREGVGRGVFRYGMTRKESVTAFFVAKKQPDQIRLVLDCRRSNQWFVEPPCTPLFSGASMGTFELEPQEELYISSLDVQAAFYQHALPEWLCAYFCLPA